MNLHLLKKVVLGVAMLLCETTMCCAQDSEQQLNLKYWTMRERFRKYFVSIGKDEGQGIPASKINIATGGGRCSALYPSSSGWKSWGDATGYLSDYMCTLATEYALLTQEGKNTTATLNELYYAINALDRLDGNAEKAFNNNIVNPDYNGFFLRDDIEQSTVSKWNTEYTNTDSADARLNCKCLNSDHGSNLDEDLNFLGQPQGNSETNEPSFDQIVTIFQGFKFIKQYVPNIYVKPTSQDVGFNIIDKIQTITSNIMEYMSGADRTLLIPDHQSEFLYNQINPSVIFSQSLGLNNLMIHYSDCPDNDVRSNWLLMNPVTGRKVGVNSLDTKNQDVRPFAWVLAKIGEQLTGNTYTDRDIHHEVVDQVGDGHACLDFHDYHIPLTWIKSHVWDVMEQLPAIEDEFTVLYSEVNVQKKPICFKINDNAITAESSLARNLYMLEVMGAISGTWSHSNVNKFATKYGHENIDLIYACLNGTNPQNSQQHYIDLLSKLSCEGPHNFGPTDFTSFWNNGNSFEHPTYDDVSTETYNHGEYNANDWMWLYNMYRLKFGDSNFPKYEDLSCNCKKSSIIEQNYDQNTLELTNSITINRVFHDYLKLGISLKEYTTQTLIIDNKTLTNKTELVICEGDVIVQNNGLFENANSLTNDSVKILVNPGSSISLNTNSTLNIGDYTKVIFKENSFMNVYDPNSKIIVGVGAQLIMNKNSILKLYNGGKIIVKSNGKLIIEPGALLELNNGSKLIVEDGGQVIIQADLSNPNATVNGLLTYNQGAIIQLKGNNAVLEINGRLHIGDNATFGFTYPGSNSGYIKFNRGQGVWWDNWAPNNAHITCGTNARINLQGQSKTDKMIDISQINVAIPKNLTQFVMAKCQVDFNDNDAQLETDRPTFINNCTFIRGNAINGRAGRGLLVFGQPTCVINKCDFIKLHKCVTGALFYSGTKLTGVTNCYFFDCTNGVLTYGGGVNTSNNNFLNVAYPIESVDATVNSFISNNTINTNSQNQTNYYSLGIGTHGANVEFDIQKNTVNNVDYALITNNTNTKLKCNDLQNNDVGLFAVDNAKVNMSDLLGAGYNNANNCGTFAKFIEANTFEADQGFNNFQITDNVPCTWIPPSGHVPNIIPGYWDCPTIMEGSLINFIDFNPLPFTHNYQIFAEQNFWRPLTSTSDVVEDRQNKVRKIDLTDINNPIIDSASIFTGNVLTNTSLVTCPTGNGGSGCVGPACRLAVHPLDDNSNSSVITTASFYNKKLQKALQFSLNKMDKMQNSNKVNQAADLLTECLTYNYATPVTNSVDKYLLELAYQKLFTCVAQLAEWHRDSSITFNPMPSSLQSRFNDLHTICALRAGRKSIAETDYKEINDLILLDKAMVYRISDNRQIALSIVNNIIASSPKATHLNMYENFRCIWSTEIEAINGNISVDKALEQIKQCNNKYSSIPKQTASSARKSNLNQVSEVVYANEHAIAVFPNPTSGNLSIAYSLKEYKSINLEIFDVQGKLLNSYKLNPEDKTTTIDNLDLENGIYFYIIKGDEKTLMSKKLVIVK